MVVLVTEDAIEIANPDVLAAVILSGENVWFLWEVLIVETIIFGKKLSTFTRKELFYSLDWIYNSHCGDFFIELFATASSYATLGMDVL